MHYLWISHPSRHFKGFEVIINLFSLYWLQRPNLNSLFHAPIHKGFALSIWLGYYKWFLRTLPYYGFTDKPKSTRKYLYDSVLSFVANKGLRPEYRVCAHLENSPKGLVSSVVIYNLLIMCRPLLNSQLHTCCLKQMAIFV